MRELTETMKWFRRNSKTGAMVNGFWSANQKGIPDNDGALTESGFQQFVSRYSWVPAEAAAELDESEAE